MISVICLALLPMPCHWSPSASHPILSRGAKKTPRGSKHPKDVPLPKFLAYLQSV